MESHPSPYVLLVDDDIDHVQMLADYLNAEGFHIQAVLNGEDGLNEALSGKFAAVILDIMLPRLSGTDVLRAIRAGSDIPVLMLTAKGDDIDRVVGLELGADDYISKPFLPRELVARLRAILRRHRNFGATGNKNVTRNGDLYVNFDRREAHLGQNVLDLTASEFNVLAALLNSAGRVLSKDEISLQALSRPRSRYDRSVDVHVSNLRIKISAFGGEGSHNIETVRGVGYMMASIK